MTYVNAGIYKGNWLNNKRHGNGEMIYNNGNYYKGDWVEDIRTGHGKMMYNDYIIIVIKKDKYLNNHMKVII